VVWGCGWRWGQKTGRRFFVFLACTLAKQSWRIQSCAAAVKYVSVSASALDSAAVVCFPAAAAVLPAVSAAAAAHAVAAAVLKMQLPCPFWVESPHFFGACLVGI